MSVEKTKQQRQTMRYNDAELATIKANFSDNEELLFALRKVMLQYDLTEKEKLLIKTLKPECVKVIKKMILPQIEIDAPLNLVGDLWSWMPIKMDERSPEQMYPYLLARRILIEYLEQQLRVVEGNVLVKGIDFKKFIDINDKPLDLYVNVLVRNTIIGHVESQLKGLEILAGTEKETPEGQKKRLSQDSSK